jgi:hypothetical protein
MIVRLPGTAGRPGRCLYLAGNRPQPHVTARIEVGLRLRHARRRPGGRHRPFRPPRHYPHRSLARHPGTRPLPHPARRQPHHPDGARRPHHASAAPVGRESRRLGSSRPGRQLRRGRRERPAVVHQLRGGPYFGPSPGSSPGLVDWTIPDDRRHSPARAAEDTAAQHQRQHGRGNSRRSGCRPSSCMATRMPPHPSSSPAANPLTSSATRHSASTRAPAMACTPVTTKPLNADTLTFIHGTPDTRPAASPAETVV